MWVCFRVDTEELEGKWMGLDGVGDGKGKRGGHTMTSPPSYATMSWSSVASAQWQRWCEVVRVEVGEVHGASGCWRWSSLTMAGAWTSGWGFDQPMNLTRYHSLPHLNLESKISSTSYSSWSLTVTGLGCRVCGCSAISSAMHGRMLQTDMLAA